MKCCRCSADATFDSPRPYCDEHWARWWGGYDAEDPYEGGEEPSRVQYQDALKLAKKRSRAEGKG